MMFSLCLYVLLLLCSLLHVSSSPESIKVNSFNTMLMRRSEGDHPSTSHENQPGSPPKSPRLRSMRQESLPVVQTRARRQSQSGNNNSPSGLRSPVQRSSPLRRENANSPDSVLKSSDVFDHHNGN